MTQKQVLAAACADTSKAITEALGWVRNDANARRISSVRSTLDRELRRSFIEADRLGKALERPMCVGLFGPSQAGKSYLISALARREMEQVLVAFDDIAPGLDFVRQINPEGGRESTGLVTRFSMRPHTDSTGLSGSSPAAVAGRCRENIGQYLFAGLRTR